MYGNDKFFTGAEAMAVFQGKLSVSSVVEARARGLQDSDVDPANEDANIVSKNLLGSGAVGTVYELTRIDAIKKDARDMPGENSYQVDIGV